MNVSKHGNLTFFHLNKPTRTQPPLKTGTTFYSPSYILLESFLEKGLMRLVIKHASRVSSDAISLVLSSKTWLPGGFPGAPRFPCQAIYIASPSATVLSDHYLHWATKLCGDTAVNHRPPFHIGHILLVPRDLLFTGVQ